jgi:hypothetical protein
MFFCKIELIPVKFLCSKGSLSFRGLITAKLDNLPDKVN